MGTQHRVQGRASWPKRGGRGKASSGWQRRGATARLPRVKIYTRTGDDGSTGILGAARVLKSDPRVEAYGSVDELNAALGLAAALDPSGAVAGEIAGVQDALFRVGAELATADPRMLDRLDRVGEAEVAGLEAWIDRLEQEVAPLTHFILPGGSVLGAQLHVARTVCRRAERRIVSLALVQAISPAIVHYLNRLADLLFVLARAVNARAKVPERVWPGGDRGTRQG